MIILLVSIASYGILFDRIYVHMFFIFALLLILFNVPTQEPSTTRWKIDFANVKVYVIKGLQLITWAKYVLDKPCKI